MSPSTWLRPPSRAGFLEMLGQHDPLIKDALRDRPRAGDFIQSVPDAGPGRATGGGAPARLPRSRTIRRSSRS